MIPEEVPMLYDALLTQEEKALRDEVRKFVRDEVPADLLRSMDRDEIKFPFEFVAKLSQHGLRGLRFPKKYGGRELPGLQRWWPKRKWEFWGWLWDVPSQ
jgi:alkylation response protein AidB-like acyl-CoA dehydrogenase